MRSFLGSNFIRTYITVGATLGIVLAVPLWQAILAGKSLPRTWAEARPLLKPLALASGHAVLRMYSWLPSLIYHVGLHGVTFQHWLFDGW